MMQFVDSPEGFRLLFVAVRLVFDIPNLIADFCDGGLNEVPTLRRGFGANSFDFRHC